MYKFLKAKGVGKFGKLEMGELGVVLRMSMVRQFDGTPFYIFDEQGKETLTGKLYTPMPKSPCRLSPGYGYRITTHIEVGEMPKGVTLEVLPSREVITLGLIPFSHVYTSGYSGRIEFSVYSCRRCTVEELVTVGYLAICGATPIDETQYVGEPEEEREEEGNEETKSTESEPEVPKEERKKKRTTTRRSRRTT